LYLIIFSTLSIASTSPFILYHDGLIDQRVQDKIKEIGTEVKEKLQTNLYLFVIENNGIDMRISEEDRMQKMREFDSKILKNLSGSYAVLVLSLDQLYANVLLSKDLEDKIDKRDIVSSYVIPLLASKDKNTLFSKTSAACLNGYAQISDVLADHKNIELKSSIGSEGKTAGTIWKMFMYTLVFAGIILYTIIIMREKKYKKMAKDGE